LEEIKADRRLEEELKGEGQTRAVGTIETYSLPKAYKKAG
jgi:hypothetical protein